MDKLELSQLLDNVASGSISTADALARIQTAPVKDIGYAQLDMARGVRQGVGEVVYGESKTAEQIAGIIEALTAAGQNHVLITRVSAEKNQQVESLVNTELPYQYYEQARIIIVGGMTKTSGNGTIIVACAGTSDLPVAEEAALTAEFLGNRVERICDVGVAGIHRLLSHTEQLAKAQVIIAVAGMEGALASVIGGLVSSPVIAVPTSIGYGAGAGGMAALLGMLNSCASGVSVVNIDNGFGAGYQASLINHLSSHNQ